MESILKPKYVFLFFKRNLLSLIFILFIVFLILFSNSNLYAVKSGLSLWVNNVIPSLLPFFIATELLSTTNIIYKLGELLNFLMRPLFNVPGIGCYAFLMGIISGYPIGAKIVSSFKDNNLCTDVEAERLIAFTNNSGPLFIIGAVGISLFGNTLIGFLLFITHILACISVAFIFRFWKCKNDSCINKTMSNCFQKSKANFYNLGEILSESIFKSIKTIFLIGGFIVLFSVILSILEKSGVLKSLSKLIYPTFNILGINDIRFCTGFLSGLIEITNGLKLICLIPSKQISINLILASFILGFGGISILLQVLSITSKSNISIKPYFIGKLLQGLLAAFYTFILINVFPIFNFNL